MKRATFKNCDELGHDYSRSKTVKTDAMGTRTKRVFYCSFCGAEKPARSAV